MTWLQLVICADPLGGARPVLVIVDPARDEQVDVELSWEDFEQLARRLVAAYERSGGRWGASGGSEPTA